MRGVIDRQQQALRPRINQVRHHQVEHGQTDLVDLRAVEKNRCAR
ncbi:hypothetical protein [Micromonospora sp. HNM0581]|nr:hypothetical protein [Micromonospora sp. HNM0581]